MKQFGDCTATLPLYKLLSQEINGSVQPKAMSSFATDIVRDDCKYNEKPSLVGLVEFYIDETATTPIANVTVAYPVRMTLQNFTSE